MAPEPPNPYLPSASVAEDRDGRAKRPARWLAVLATVFCSTLFAGLGLYVLGRPRRFVAWTALAVVAWALLSAAVWLEQPKLALAAGGAIAFLALGSLVDTLVAKPGASAPSFRRALLVVLIVFVGTRAAGYAVKANLVEAFSIPSAGMAPSLLPGDHVLVRKETGSIRRGDVVVLRHPRTPKVSYIKRVVALAGDSLQIRDNQVIVNGTALPQSPTGEACPSPTESPADGECRVLREDAGPRSYLVMLDASPASDLPPLRIPAGHVFVLGDNRHNSQDGRHWGPLPLANVTGKPSFVYWSRNPGGEIRWDRMGRRL